MKTKFGLKLLCLLTSTLCLQAFAQSTAFTYQGWVIDNGTNFTGAGQFKFALVTSSNASHTATATANAPSGGYITGYTVTFGGNGYVTAPTVTVFGGGGSGAAAHANLTSGAVTSIGVDNTGNGNYTGTPTVLIAPPPPDISYTTYWSNDGTSVAGSEPAAGVNVSVDNGLLSVLLGDTTLVNMVPMAASLFTQSNLQLLIWFNDGVNGSAALSPAQNLTPSPYALAASALLGGFSVQANNTNGAPNVLGGSSVNFIAGGVVGATLSGGGAVNYGGQHYTNSVTGDFGTVSGGRQNTASGQDATVSGGYYNTASGEYATVGGGVVDIASGDDATVGGGYFNKATNEAATVAGGSQNTASSEVSTVSGGDSNIATNYAATVGGGESNTAGGGSATIGGGEDNTANGNQATIGGGYANIAGGDYGTVGGGADNVASGKYGTVSGGVGNVAGGEASFAAGSIARANHNGSFVWADDYAIGFSSTTSNQFRVRSTGGVAFVTGIDSSGTVTSGVHLLSGDTAWSAISDKNAKKNFQPVDGEAVLDKLATIPVQKWNYKWEADTNTPHIGPMAQDFKGAFYPGRDDKSISTLEFDGVELAAIQGLNQKLAEKGAEIQGLKEKNEALETKLKELETAVRMIAAKK